MTIRPLHVLAFVHAAAWVAGGALACVSHISRTSAAIRCPECSSPAPNVSIRGGDPSRPGILRSTMGRERGASAADIPDGVRRSSAPEAQGEAPAPILYLVTAYSHGCTMPGNGRREPVAARGANGRWPVVDVTVAADTNLHPMGSALIVAGQWRIVGDKGGSIRGRRLDLFTNTCAEARAFGVQRLPVWTVPPATTAEAAR